MKQEIQDKVDRVEGNKIILYDSYPKESRELKAVEIITPHKTVTYSLQKTKYGNYMMQ